MMLLLENIYSSRKFFYPIDKIISRNHKEYMSLCKTRARKASWNRVEFYGPEIDTYTSCIAKKYTVL